MELDAALVEKARSGDREAFDEIVQQLWGPVFVFVRGRINDEEKARDLAQDTFLRALDKLDTLRSGQSLMSWIFTIASHRVIDCYRRQGTQPKMRGYDTEIDGDGLTGRAPTGRDFTEAAPTLGVEQAEDAERLQAAMQQLHDRYRAVLILRYWSGMSPAQIARLLGEPEGTIRNRIFRAHRQLQGLLED
ncbi:MAG: RNA polymerase sigma factor [Planctomycetota bacterium]